MRRCPFTGRRFLLPSRGDPPGASRMTAFAESFAKGLKNCRVVQLASGIHYLQEDHAEDIGANVKEWLIDLGVGFSAKRKVAS
jgi:haloalkane dehalogenase